MRRSLAALLVALPLALAALVASPAPARADFRFGVSVEGGGLVGPQPAGMGGLALRLGFDIAGPVSIYAQSHGFVGRLTTGPHEGTAQGLMWNTLMLDLHFGPLHVAAGPSIDLAWGCTAGNGPTQGCVNGAPLFGVDGRIALQFDHVMISADVHPTWVNDQIVTGIVAGLGWEL